MTAIRKTAAAAVVFAATFAYSTAVRASEPSCQQYVAGCYESGGVPYVWPDSCYYQGNYQWCLIFCDPFPGSETYCYTAT